MSLKLERESQTEERVPLNPPKAEPKIGSIMWGILIVAALAEISYGTINFSATPVYIQTLGLDSSWIAIIAVSYLLSEALFKTPFGALGDRFGRKRLLVIAPLISAVTALLTVFVHNPYLLMLLRAIDGMALAALWPSAFGIISDYARAGERAKAMSLFNISYMAGIALAPALGGGINDFAEAAFHLPPTVAKQASFYACSILFIITSVVAFRLLPSHCPHHAIEETKTTSETGELSLEGGFSLASFKQMLSQIPMLMLLAFIIFMGVGMIIPYAKLILIEHFHLKESEYGGLIFFPAVVIGFLSVALGTLGDKIGKVKASRLGLGLAMAGFFFALAFPSKYLLLLFGVIIGTGYVIAYPSLFAYVSDCVAPKQRGTALGAVGTAQGFGAILGGALSAPLYKASEMKAGGLTIPEHGLPFVACAFLLLLAFLVAMFGLKQKPQTT